MNNLKQFIRQVSAWYARIFSLEEIRQLPTLRWYFGGSLLYFFLTFSNWINANKTSLEAYQTGQAVCWPYFQNCADFAFLHTLYVNYSTGIFYMALYTVMLAIVYAMWRRRWTLAHGLLSILFIWEALVAFALSYVGGPYYYYHLFLTAILLFIPHKEYFLQRAFVLFYFLSATIKFDEGWIVGTYFTSLQTGLPLLPDGLAPVFTNVVIFSQVILCWFLLSRNKYLQRGALLFFVFFHLYSGVLVGYNYPTAAIVPLLILFGPLYRRVPTPLDKKSVAGWIALVLVIAFQAIGFLIPGDRRMTLEGDRYGMFMFEADHQCRIVATVRSRVSDAEGRGALARWESQPGNLCFNYLCLTGVSERYDGTIKERSETFESNFSMYRCDPYELWARYQPRCKLPSTERIGLTLDHSINGGPFYRIVNTENVCDLTYKPFSKNEWIKEPPEAPIIGVPVKNFYHY